MGIALQKMEKYMWACDSFNQAMKIYEKAFGQTNPQYIQCLVSVADN